MTARWPDVDRPGGSATCTPSLAPGTRGPAEAPLYDDPSGSWRWDRCPRRPAAHQDQAANLSGRGDCGLPSSMMTTSPGTPVFVTPSESTPSHHDAWMAGTDSTHFIYLAAFDGLVGYDPTPLLFSKVGGTHLPED